MNGDALASALGAAGLHVRVEVRDRLAVLVADLATFADPTWRERAVALAREHGFTHVAVELPAEDPRAPLSGD